jgi:tetratricopeptide (TPR) repeat protein
MNRRWRGLILGLILLICTAGVYFPARHFQFVDWDDYDEVTQNPLLHPATAQHLHQIWTQPYLRLYAPLTYSVWWVMSNISLTANSPTAFHVLDIVLHLICVALVYSVLLKCVECRVASFAGATLFALHPMQVESVAWVAETNNLLAAALSLAAIRIYLATLPPPVMLTAGLRGRAGEGVEDERPHRWLIAYSIASLVFLLALFAKPTAVVTPIVVALLAVLLFHRTWQRTLTELAPWFLAAICFSLIAHQAQPAHITRMLDRPIVAIDALAFYLAKLAWPANLGIDYARTPAMVLASKDWIIAAIVVIALAMLLYLLRNKDRRIPVAVLIMLAGLLPILGFVPFAFQEWSTVADRFIYLAMLGPALALAAILCHIKQSKALIIASAMGLVLTYLTSTQLQIWRNTDALVKHALAKNPDSVIGHSIAGAELNRVGMPAEAARHFSAAIARDPGNADLHYNLANALQDAGKYEQSIVEYQHAIELGNSPNTKPLNNMGVSYAKLGDPDMAKIMFNRVLEMDPQNADAKKNLQVLTNPH